MSERTDRSKREFSAEDLERLLRVRLTAEQRAELEARASDDAFAADALEGYRSMDDPARAMSKATAASERVSSELGLTSEGGRSIPMRRWLAIAALLALVAGTAVLTARLVTEDETLAMGSGRDADDLPPIPQTTTIDQGELEVNEGAAEEAMTLQDTVAAPRPLLDDVQPPALDRTAVVEQGPDGRNEVSEPSVEDDEEPSLSVLDVEEKAEAFEDEVFAGATEETTVRTESRQSTEALRTDDELTPITADDMGAMNAPARIMERTTSVAPASEEGAPLPTGFSVGLSAYKAHQYDEAITAFERSIRNGRLIPESHYYIGMSHFFSDRYTQAITAFDQVIAAGDDNTSNARWYRAECLVRLGRIDEAIQELQRLADGGGLYAEEARRKMGSLRGE